MLVLFVLLYSLLKDATLLFSNYFFRDCLYPFPFLSSAPKHSFKNTQTRSEVFSVSTWLSARLQRFFDRVLQALKGQAPAASDPRRRGSREQGALRNLPERMESLVRNFSQLSQALGLDLHTILVNVLHCTQRLHFPGLLEVGLPGLPTGPSSPRALFRSRAPFRTPGSRGPGA